MREPSAPNTKHTPGPWRVGSSFGQSNGSEQSYGHVIETAHGTSGTYTTLPDGSVDLRPHVQLVAQTRYTDRTREQGEANARLIAAAPEMLDALRWIASQESFMFAECSLAEEIIGRARAAIDRVDGGT